MTPKEQILQKIEELKLKAKEYNWKKLELKSIYDRQGSDLYVFYHDRENFVNQKIELLNWVLKITENAIFDVPSDREVIKYLLNDKKIEKL